MKQEVYPFLDRRATNGALNSGNLRGIGAGGPMDRRHSKPRLFCGHSHHLVAVVSPCALGSLS